MEPADFDPEDKYSWFFGQLPREEATRTLQNMNQNGVFLVRESKSQIGNFVLCVKEKERVSHYIIDRVNVDGGPPRYKIGDQEFGDMASLLHFYKTHFLDTTTLIRPATRKKLMTKFDFPGKDPEDLPFRKGETLEVLSQDEEEWWTARNCNGQIGQIPVSYTSKIDSGPISQQELHQQQQIYQNPENNPLVTLKDQIDSGPNSHQQRQIFPENNSLLLLNDIDSGPNSQVIHQEQQVSPENNSLLSLKDRHLPAFAIVTRPRNPNVYDKKQLKLEVDQILLVTRIHPNGQWEGQLNTEKKGIFPFTHIRFLTQEEVEKFRLPSL